MDEKDLTSPTLHTPNPWAKKLVEALLPYTTVKTYRKGIRLTMQEGDVLMCRLVISGSAEVYRSSDGLLMARLPSPGIIGFSGLNASYIITSESCKIATLSLEEFHQHIQEQNLWEVLAKYMLLMSKKIFYYSKLMSAPTAYEAIRSQLLELAQEPESLRKTISVERYIRDRTHLSRSSIMKILAELKKGGYVTIEEGKLLKINHLPLKY